VIEPASVVNLVEAYVYKELADTAKYDNRTPLDESGIFSLHRLTADVYALGFADGEQSEAVRGRERHLREKSKGEDVTHGGPA
jgi:hypothetical protein